MSQKAVVSLPLANRYASPELWHRQGREIKLGCSRCPVLRYCGGLSTDAPLFDCMSLCCGSPSTCTKYACPKKRDYSNFVNEVGGFDLKPYWQPVANRGVLPSYVPFLVDRGTLAGPIRLEAVALSLYSVIDPLAGVAKFETRQQLTEHFRLDPHTKVIITASGLDQSVEHFWYGLRNKATAQSIAKLQPWLITTPNFSMHANTVRHDNLVSMSRIAYCFEAFAAAGLPVAPHINGRTPFDFERWTEFLIKSPGIHTISYELGTAGRSSVRRAWHADQLAQVARSVKRPLTLLIRAGSAQLPTLIEAYSRVTFVDSTPIMKAKKRQSAFIVRGTLRWDALRTDADQPIDELFIQNVKTARRHYRSRFALARANAIASSA